MGGGKNERGREEGGDEEGAGSRGGKLGVGERGEGGVVAGEPGEKRSYTTTITLL